MARLPWLIRTRFLNPYEILPIVQVQNNSGNILNLTWICMLCVLIRNIMEAVLMSTLNIPLLSRRSKTKSLNYRHLLPDLATWLTLSGSNYPYLEHISMVPKRFVIEVWLFFLRYIYLVHKVKCEMNVKISSQTKLCRIIRLPGMLS